jgi:hypothetical protein
MLRVMPSDDEIIKAANRFFSKLGSTVRDAGKAAKKAGQQVTGIGRGTVRVALDKTRYAPGQDLAGTVTLALPEPIDAKALTVTLRATQRSLDYHRTGGVRTVGASNATVYEQTQELAGLRNYTSETLPFTLPIPADARDRKPPAPSGRLGDVARAVSSVVAPTTGPLEWRVTVSLVIPWGRDLEHTIDLVVD